MTDRLLNIFFFFATLFVFLLVAKGDDHLRFLYGLILSFLFVTLAFVLNWITLDGAASSLLFGTISLGFGGWTGAAVILAFFVSSSLVSKDPKDEEGSIKIPFRRNAIQVWANGFWFALWILVWFLSQEPIFLVAAISSMAFSTSDTWASEIGAHRANGTTWLITGFKKVQPGVDGGISVVGTIASLAGSAFLTLVFWILSPEYHLGIYLTVAISGFLGCFLDSWIGASLQGKKLYKWVLPIFANKISIVDNNMTNWLAAGGASVIALFIALLFGTYN